MSIRTTTTIVAKPTPNKERIKVINLVLGNKQRFDKYDIPFIIGTSCPIKVIPPAPKYCPSATSWKKMGIPQNIIATK